MSENKKVRDGLCALNVYSYEYAVYIPEEMSETKEPTWIPELYKNIQKDGGITIGRTVPMIGEWGTPADKFLEPYQDVFLLDYKRCLKRIKKDKLLNEFEILTDTVAVPQRFLKEYRRVEYKNKPTEIVIWDNGRIDKVISEELFRSKYRYNNLRHFSYWS